MYERMLDKQNEPTIAEMTAYCGENGELFALLNEWLAQTYGTVQKPTFPYGNHYGWGIAATTQLPPRSAARETRSPTASAYPT